jgi:hypothetical protein
MSKIVVSRSFFDVEQISESKKVVLWKIFDFYIANYNEIFIQLLRLKYSLLLIVLHVSLLFHPMLKQTHRTLDRITVMS